MNKETPRKRHLFAPSICNPFQLEIRSLSLHGTSPSDFTFAKHHEKHLSVFRTRRPWLHRIEHCRRRAGRHPQRADRQFERRAARGSQHGQSRLTPALRRLSCPDRRRAGPICSERSAFPSSRLPEPAPRFLPQRTHLIRRRREPSHGRSPARLVSTQPGAQVAGQSSFNISHGWSHDRP